jgi:hypothetical protein
MSMCTSEEIRSQIEEETLVGSVLPLPANSTKPGAALHGDARHRLANAAAVGTATDRREQRRLPSPHNLARLAAVFRLVHHHGRNRADAEQFSISFLTTTRFSMAAHTSLLQWQLPMN